MIPLDGPLPIYRRDASGDLTDELAAGSFWHTTPEGLAERPELQPYVADPPVLQRVWAGDDPAAPVITVPLRFADQAQAEAVLGPNPQGAG